MSGNLIDFWDDVVDKTGNVGGDISKSATSLWKEISGRNASVGAADAQRAANVAAGKALKNSVDSQLDLEKPWDDLGDIGYGRLSALSKVGGLQYKPAEFDTTNNPGMYGGPNSFKADKFNFEADPGYQFRKEQMQADMAAKGSAAGNMYSGGTLAALADRSGKMASDEYDRAYGRYSDQRDFGANENERFNRLSMEGNKLNNDTFGSARDAHGKFQELKMKSHENMLANLNNLAGYGERATNRKSAIVGDFGNNIANLELGKGDITANRSMSVYNSGRSLVGDILGGAAKVGGAIYGAK